MHINYSWPMCLCCWFVCPKWCPSAMNWMHVWATCPPHVSDVQHRGEVAVPLVVEPVST